MKELVILVADKSVASAVRGILSRPDRLGTRSLRKDDYQFVGPFWDSGCRLNAHMHLRPQINQFKFALVMFDREGCGAEELSAQEIESQVEELLFINGWDQRAAAIVFDPELEIWFWSDSPHVDEVLGWQNTDPTLRTWLRKQKLLQNDQSKPKDPKEAMRKALKEASKPLSSSLYEELAQKVSLSKCIDPAFVKFKKTLQRWFPPRSK